MVDDTWARLAIVGDAVFAPIGNRKPTSAVGVDQLVPQAVVGQHPLVGLDGQGRLLLPTIVRETTAMAGEVVVTAQIDRLEIWNRERLERKLEAEPFTDDDFAALAARGI